MEIQAMEKEYKIHIDLDKDDSGDQMMDAAVDILKVLHMNGVGLEKISGFSINFNERTTDIPYRHDTDLSPVIEAFLFAKGLIKKGVSLNYGSRVEAISYTSRIDDFGASDFIRGNRTLINLITYPMWRIAAKKESFTS